MGLHQAWDGTPKLGEPHAFCWVRRQGSSNEKERATPNPLHSIQQSEIYGRLVHLRFQTHQNLGNSRHIRTNKLRATPTNRSASTAHQRDFFARAARVVEIQHLKTRNRMSASRFVIHDRLILRARATSDRETDLPFLKRHSLVNNLDQTLHSLAKPGFGIPCEDDGFPMIFSNQNSRSLELIALPLNGKKCEIKVRRNRPAIGLAVVIHMEQYSFRRLSTEDFSKHRQSGGVGL